MRFKDVRLRVKEGMTILNGTLFRLISYRIVIILQLRIHNPNTHVRPTYTSEQVEFGWMEDG